MAIDIISLGASKKYTAETAEGMGAVVGQDGKSAYQSAVDAGYTGTETQFNSDLLGVSNVTNAVTAISTPSKNLINTNDPNYVQGNIASSSGKMSTTESSFNTYRTTGYIPVSAGQSVVCSPRVRVFLAYNSSKVAITSTYMNTATQNYVFTATENCYIRASVYLADAAQIEYGETPTSYVPYGATKSLSDTDKEMVASASNDKINILANKKWCVIGDSFTEGNFNGSVEPYTFTSGRFTGKNKTYQYLIAERNDMNIQDLSKGGRTMAVPADGSFSNCVALSTCYQTIASDVDYITIYIGINDSHHRPNASGSDGEDTTGVITIGTITDESTDTFYGAYNTVIKWIQTNRPYAHIGIIVSNACETDDYRLATIAIAKKYGIPYIDMNGDARTPVMHRSTNPSIDASVRTAKSNAFAVVKNTNEHPNVKAHAYESVFIENFLRSL